MDYFMDFDNFYNRIEADYLKHGRLIIAYDFDQTVYNTYKMPDRTFECMIDILQRWRDRARFIVWSVSTPSRYPMMKEFLSHNDIPFDTINENIIILDYDDDEEPRKVYANVYLDDRAGPYWGYRALLKLIEKIERDEL